MAVKGFGLAPHAEDGQDVCQSQGRNATMEHKQEGAAEIHHCAAPGSAVQLGENEAAQLDGVIELSCLVEHVETCSNRGTASVAFPPSTGQFYGLAMEAPLMYYGMTTRQSVMQLSTSIPPLVST